MKNKKFQETSIVLVRIPINARSDLLSNKIFTIDGATLPRF